MIRGASVSLALLLLSSPAFAWRHINRVWLPDDFPIPYWVADDGTDGDPELCAASGGLESCCEETVPGGYCTQAAAEGFEAWQAAECAEFSVQYQGVGENLTYTDDGRFLITFNDPADENEPGVLAATRNEGAINAFVLDGEIYKHTTWADIVFNENVAYTTHEKVLSGECNGEVNMRTVMTHEIGHALGMGHSCEDPNKPEQGGGPCPDPVLRDATMNWSEDQCQSKAFDINEDDIEGFNALYGPFATFACSHEVTDDLVVGVVPFELKCVVVSDFLFEVKPEETEWTFGDGQTAVGLSAANTYTEAGNYTIQLTVRGDRDQCGPEGWENTYRKVGYVRACGLPEPSFAVDHVDGLKYQMLNDSDVSVYGCLSNIEWEAYKGSDTSGEPVISGITAWEPILEFPDEGEYTVLMNLGGIGGTSAAKATFMVENTRGQGRGCDTTGPVGPLSALSGFGALFGASVLLRRRRS